MFRLSLFVNFFDIMKVEVVPYIMLMKLQNGTLRYLIEEIEAQKNDYFEKEKIMRFQMEAHY